MDAFELGIYIRYRNLMIAAKSVNMDDFFSANPQKIQIEDVADMYDAFCFDGYGTLYNRGNFVYDGALDWYRFLRAKGKHLRLVTNAASDVDKALAYEAEKRGFDFEASETISSGSLLQELASELRTRGRILDEAFYIGRPSGVKVLDACGITPKEFPNESVVCISSAKDTPESYARALEILRQPNSLLIVLNSDAWAPNIDGTRNPVSGALCERLRLEASASGHSVETHYLGKPFPAIWKKLKN